jgi:hypothetical protein
MQKLLFVHGIGVREESYATTFDFVTGEIRAELPHLLTSRCYWGDIGASLHLNGASIPTYQTARADGAPDASEPIALWRLLYEDPFYELRYLAGLPQRMADLPPNVERPDEILRRRLAVLDMPAALDSILNQYGLKDLWSTTLDAVRDNQTTVDAVSRDQEDTVACREAVARALVAMLLATALSGQRPMPAGEVRDHMVDIVVNELGGGARSAAGWLGNQLTGIAESVSSFWVRRKRGKVSDASLPTIGDVLLYQSRGNGIRARIRETILDNARQPDGSQQPVVVLAHSLGGIACVELLAAENLPVSHLITCGSQSPLFYEMDALATLRLGQSLPETFPRWLNIYDENDFLSYIGESVFAGRVRDVPVASKQPFPQSHSAYWGIRKVWNEIGKFLAESGTPAE